ILPTPITETHEGPGPSGQRPPPATRRERRAYTRALGCDLRCPRRDSDSPRFWTNAVAPAIPTTYLPFPREQVMSRNYYSEINLHLIWHTKLSLPLLTAPIEKEVHHAIRGKLINTAGAFIHE